MGFVWICWGLILRSVGVFEVFFVGEFGIVVIVDMDRCGDVKVRKWCNFI